MWKIAIHGKLLIQSDIILEAATYSEAVRSFETWFASAPKPYFGEYEIVAYTGDRKDPDEVEILAHNPDPDTLDTKWVLGGR